MQILEIFKLSTSWKLFCKLSQKDHRKKENIKPLTTPPPPPNLDEVEFMLSTLERLPAEE